MDAPAHTAHDGRAFLVRVERARLTYPGASAPVLDNLDWTLRPGEHTALFGSNGAGKSTLLRLLRGEAWLDHTHGGSIAWNAGHGPETSPLTARSMAALVSTAQQEQYIRQGWSISGEDLLCSGFSDSPLLYGAPPEAHRRAARELACRWRMAGLLCRTADTLSQGQLRLLLLGRALLRRPQLLLLDEYTDGLDAATRDLVMDALRDAACHATLVMTAHRPDTIPDFIRRRLFLKDGKLTDNLPAWYVPDQLPSSVFLAASESAACVGPCAAAKEAALQDAPPLVDVRSATVYVDRAPVLHDITWTLRQGEHWRLNGPNGSGKSTLLRLLAGDEYPALGGSIVRYLPRHGGATTELEQIRRGVRLVSDAGQATYAYDVTGLELVLTGFDNAVGVYRQAAPVEEEEALRWMQLLGVRPLSGRRIRSLSTGQLRRLMLARSLVGTPDLLLLDEPCSGLDMASRTQFMEILQDIASLRIHLVLVSHHAMDCLPCITHEAHMDTGRLYI